MWRHRQVKGGQRKGTSSWRSFLRSSIKNGMEELDKVDNGIHMHGEDVFKGLLNRTSMSKVYQTKPTNIWFVFKTSQNFLAEKKNKNKSKLLNLNPLIINL